MLNTKIIGKRIADARKRINISQAQLARQLFISSQAVGKWERGESLPDIITLNRLAGMLGVDLNYFSENLPPETTETAPADTWDDQPAEVESTDPMLSPSGKTKQKPNWDMSRGNWVDADFSGLRQLHDKFSSSNMQRCRFNSSDLSGLLLKGNNVEGCDFTDSDISSSHIHVSYLTNNIFRNCSLMETEFSGSHIESCDFSGAIFMGTEFSKSHITGCDLTGCDFSGAAFKSGGITGVANRSGTPEKNIMTNAVWSRTSFHAMYIADIVFEGTVGDCSFENCAFKRVTFQHATLINTFFKNKSLKGIRFIDCQADRLTYEFLKNGKADLTGITLLTPKEEDETSI